MTFSFRPLSLAEAHRRRATLLPFRVALATADVANATRNEQGNDEDEEVTA